MLLFGLMVGILSITSINSVMSCMLQSANLTSSVVCLEIVVSIDVSEAGYLLATKQRTFKCNIEIFSVFILFINFWKFRRKPCDAMTHMVAMFWCCKLCAFFSGPPCMSSEYRTVPLQKLSFLWTIATIAASASPSMLSKSPQQGNLRTNRQPHWSSCTVLYWQLGKLYKNQKIKIN